MRIGVRHYMDHLGLGNRLDRIADLIVGSLDVFLSIVQRSRVPWFVSRQAKEGE
jgi:hypothetical protein